MLDVTHALVLEGSDPSVRQEADKIFEQGGHDLRVELDESYKRRTWGTRPEDTEAVKSLMGDVAGKR